MAEEIRKFFQTAHGSWWYGRCRAGTGAAMVLLCRQLDAPDTHIFSERRKIKTGSTGNCFVKRYNLPGIFTQLRRLLKTPRPLTVMRGAAFLHDNGIPTPRVLAALAEFNGLRRREYLITELLTPADTLLNILAKELSAEEFSKLLMEKFIPMLAKMHHAGAIHGDLSLRNLYRTGCGEAGLIDLDGIEIGRKPVKKPARAKEVARLISSYIIVCAPEANSRQLAETAVKAYENASGITLPLEYILQTMDKFISRRKKQ